MEPRHTSRRQFRIYNVIMVLAMSFGSMGYGYSASITATTLGMMLTTPLDVHISSNLNLAQPSFIKYFELDTRSDATSLISTMNVCV